MKPTTLDTHHPFLSTTPILDIFVVWHPKDKEGALICDALLKHYHSDMFAGLTENTIEVYGRSSTSTPENNTNKTIPPIAAADGTVGYTKQQHYIDNKAKFSTILIFIGEHLIRSSLHNDSEWHN